MAFTYAGHGVAVVHGPRVYGTRQYSVHQSLGRWGRPNRIGNTRRAVLRMVSELKLETSEDARCRTGSPHNITVILLAGGVGKRMGSKVPKQLLPLGGLTVLERSLDALRDLEEVSELVVVLDESLQNTAAGRACAAAGAKFALPGAERVDSVAAGVRAASDDATMFCVHDAARPLVRRDDVRKVISDGWKRGAAVLAVPCKATVKSSSDGILVDKTLERSKLWEMQTPQVIDADTLRRGLAAAATIPGAKVTDDVSLVELLGLPVVLTHGSYDNIKLTTPEDMLFAEAVLKA